MFLIRCKITECFRSITVAIENSKAVAIAVT
jgi:hypothetical protein